MSHKSTEALVPCFALNIKYNQRSFARHVIWYHVPTDLNNESQLGANMTPKTADKYNGNGRSFLGWLARHGD